MTKQYATLEADELRALKSLILGMQDQIHHPGAKDVEELDRDVDDLVYVLEHCLENLIPA